MEQESLRIVIIANEEEDLNFYGEVLASYENTTLETYSSIKQFRTKSLGMLYSGFVVDIRTLVRSSADEKYFFFTLLEAFPVIRVSKKPRATEFSALLVSEDLGRLKGKQALDAFVYESCQKVPPREIRSDRRHARYMSANLYFSQNFGGEVPVKATIENLSKGGCYVITNHKCLKGSNLWLVITGMKNQTPIPCEVKWFKPWTTKARYLPGAGVAFGQILPAQVKELNDSLA